MILFTAFVVVFALGVLIGNDIQREKITRWIRQRLKVEPKSEKQSKRTRKK